MSQKEIKDQVKSYIRELIERHDIKANRLPKEGRYTHSELSPYEMGWLWAVSFQHHPSASDVARIESMRPGLGKQGTLAFYVTWVGKKGITTHNEFWSWTKGVNAARYSGLPDHF